MRSEDCSGMRAMLSVRFHGFWYESKQSRIIHSRAYEVVVLDLDLRKSLTSLKRHDQQHLPIRNHTNYASSSTSLPRPGSSALMWSDQLER
ncbi:hypothetical protein ACRRTK_022497 [Alexandromys fortis]